MSKVIAITGGIGSGKSTVRRMIQDMGYQTLDSDSVNARLLLEPSYLSRLADSFPTAVTEGSVDKAVLRRILAENAEAFDVLDGIARSVLPERIGGYVYALSQTNPVVFVEVPLLFEWGMQSAFDEVWLVFAPTATRLSRALARGGMTEREVRAMMSRQCDAEVVKYLADVVIDNDGDEVSLSRAVTDAVEALRART